MAQLIVDHAGQTRRFRLNPGQLTLGSGERATLRLKSGSLAEVHLELEYGDGGLVLRPKPGVTPPRAGEREITKPARLRAGTEVTVGDVSFRIEAEEGDPESIAPRAAARPGAAPSGAASSGAASSGAASSGAASASPTRSAASSPARTAAASPTSAPRRPGARAGRQAGTPRPSTGQRRSTVERTRSRVDRRPGVPTWVTLLGVGAALLILWVAVQAFAKDAGEDAFAAKTSYLRIKEAVERGNYGEAIEEFRDKVDKNKGQWGSYAKSFEQLRERAEQGYADATRNARFGKGTDVLEKSIKRFERSYLSPPRRPAARVFVKRAEAWLREYPGHPQEGWAQQKAARYREVAKMTEPATYADVLFEAGLLVQNWPHDYVAAFAMMEAYADLHASDAGSVETQLAIWRAERQENFDERMDLAAGYWEDANVTKTVQHLTEIIVRYGDPAMADDAAQRFVAMHGYVRTINGVKTQHTLVDTMRELRDRRPEFFAALKKNATIAGFCREHGI